MLSLIVPFFAAAPAAVRPFRGAPAKQLCAVFFQPPGTRGFRRCESQAGRQLQRLEDRFRASFKIRMRERFSRFGAAALCGSASIYPVFTLYLPCDSAEIRLFPGGAGFLHGPCWQGSTGSEATTRQENRGGENSNTRYTNPLNPPMKRTIEPVPISRMIAPAAQRPFRGRDRTGNDAFTAETAGPRAAPAVKPEKEVCSRRAANLPACPPYYRKNPVMVKPLCDGWRYFFCVDCSDPTEKGKVAERTKSCNNLSGELRQTAAATEKTGRASKMASAKGAGKKQRGLPLPAALKIEPLPVGLSGGFRQGGENSLASFS